MKNAVKKIALLIAALIMLISFGCSSAFAASCLFGHKAVATPSVEATCTENGSYGGSYCSNCGTVIEEATVVSTKGHTQSETPTLTPATAEADGAYSYACVNCNVIMESGAIPKIDSETVVLSATKYTYNGKDRKPTVTVKDTTGKALVEGQDYDLVYPESMIMPGKYEVTVIFKGNYSGENKLSFTVVPKATTGIKAKTTTVNSITLQWTKTAGATGYEIYKYNSSTKKYEKIKSVTANSYKVTNLKGNTNYKFKVRAYTKAADGTIIYGANSNVFTAKTKIAYSVKFAGSSATIYIGATKQLKATTNPAKRTLTWKSSDTSIAKVSSNGVVTALKKGTVTITASFKAEGKTYKSTYKITVKKPSVKLSDTSAIIIEGRTLNLSATTAPTDLKVTWKSSNTSVATVSTTGKITGKKVGTAKITASITYKGTTYQTTCKVTIKKVASASENITTLINYIKKNGKINRSGLKYITLSDYIPGYNENYTVTIFYHEDKDCLEFGFNDFESTKEWIHVTAYLNRSGTYMDYSGRITSDYNNPPSYYPYTIYKLEVVGTINPSEYVSPYSPQKFVVQNSYPTNQQSYANGILYNYTDEAMESWDCLLTISLGLRLNDLGFVNYH